MKFFLLSILILLMSCTRDKGLEINPSCTIPEKISYSKDVQPLLTTNCLGGGCHQGTNPAGNLDLSSANSYKELSESGSGYIDTINPKFSVLNAQLNSASNPMPPTGKLTDCNLQLIYQWMEQGAKNN